MKILFSVTKFIVMSLSLRNLLSFLICYINLKFLIKCSLNLSFTQNDRTIQILNDVLVEDICFKTRIIQESTFLGTSLSNTYSIKRVFEVNQDFPMPEICD